VIGFAVLALVVIALTQDAWTTNAAAKIFSFRLRHVERVKRR
jgi:hypothetical protein